MAAAAPIIAAVGTGLSGAASFGSLFSGGSTQQSTSLLEEAQQDFMRAWAAQQSGNMQTDFSHSGSKDYRKWLDDYLAHNVGAASEAQKAYQQQQMDMQTQQWMQQQEASQGFVKDLLAQQNQYNIDAEQRSLTYSDPAFLRARAEAAGYNPNVALGTNAVQALGTSMPSVPSGAQGDSPGFSDRANRLKASRTEEIQRKIQNLSQIMQVGRELDQYADERAARKSQLKAQELDNKMKAEQLAEFALQRLHNTFLRGRDYVDARHKDADWSFNAWDRMANSARSAEAHSMEMGLKGLAFEHSSRDLVYKANQEARDQGLYDDARAMNKLVRMNEWLQFRLGNADLSEKELTLQWRREHNGELPPTSVNSYDSSQPRSFVGKIIADAIGDGSGSGNNLFSKSWDIYPRFSKWLRSKISR